MSYLDERAGLEGKVAVVTGGAGGLGWPISRDLAKAGLPVAVCDRDAEAIERVSDELAGFGVPVLLSHADVREPDQMETFFADIDKMFGRIDVLVNVPGGGFVAPLMNTNAKGWNAILRENLIYVFDTTQRAVERMRTQDSGGSIMYITSVEAHRAVPNRAVYGACKAGLTNLAMTLSLELADDNIRVNTVAPDIFPTVDPGQSARIAAGDRIAIPMARTGTGEDLSGCVLFLSSNLSSYVTGTTLHVDGGTLASSGWFNFADEGYSNLAPDLLLDAMEQRGDLEA